MIMTAECITTCDRLQSRTELLQQLVTSLQQSPQALQRNDISEFLRRTSCQQVWCEQLQTSRLSEFSAPDESAAAAIRERWHALAARLAMLQAELGQLNQVSAAVLRKMQRMLRIKSFLLMADDATYASQASCSSLGREK
jgi:hypothetical protein